WLPKGVTLVSGGTRRTVVSIEAGRKPYSAPGGGLNGYAAGHGHLTPPPKTPKTGTARPPSPTTRIAPPPPPARGDPARWAGPGRSWWGRPGLSCESPRTGWSCFFLPNMYRYSPQQIRAVKRDAVKIAGHIRYGAPTLPLMFPAQLTPLPRNWRVSSVFYL